MFNRLSSPIKEIFIILDDERTKQDPEHYAYLLTHIPEEILNSDKTVFIKTPNEFWSLWEQHKNGELKITGISFDNDLGINKESSQTVCKDMYSLEDKEYSLTSENVYFQEGNVTSENVYFQEGNVTSENVYFQEGNVTSENVYFQEGSSILRELLWFRNEIEEVKAMIILVHTGNNQARRTFESLLQSLNKV